MITDKTEGPLAKGRSPPFSHKGQATRTVDDHLDDVDYYNSRHDRRLRRRRGLAKMGEEGVASTSFIRALEKTMESSSFCINDDADRDGFKHLQPNGTITIPLAFGGR